MICAVIANAGITGTVTMVRATNACCPIARAQHLKRILRTPLIRGRSLNCIRGARRATSVRTARDSFHELA